MLHGELQSLDSKLMRGVEPTVRTLGIMVRSFLSLTVRTYMA